MRLSTTPDTQRVNPTEMRYLRAAVATTALCCLPTAIQSVVASAHVAHGMDLTQEAKVLLLEHEAAQAQPLMRVAR